MSSSPSCTFSRIISPYQAVGHQYQSSVEGWHGYGKAQYKARNFNMTVHNIHSITSFVHKSLMVQNGKLTSFTNWLGYIPRRGSVKINKGLLLKMKCLRTWGRPQTMYCMFMKFPVFFTCLAKMMQESPRITAPFWLDRVKDQKNHTAQLIHCPTWKTLQIPKTGRIPSSHHNRAKSLY